ncbi:MAG TPA: adenylyl-sulfate kinase, partial [Anaeromyxobacter sp.]
RLAALLARQGLVVVVAATANRAVHRDRARALAPRYVEVHVATPAAECQRRDPKGLYAAAQAGLVAGLPGLDAAYEAPPSAEVTASGGEDDRAVDRVMEILGAGRLAAGGRTRIEPVERT